MSLFDMLSGVLGNNVDMGAIAQQVGIDPAVASQAVAALGAAHNQDGDTVATASAQTGIDPDTLNSVVSALGGHEGLGQVAQMIEGNPQITSGLMGMLGGQGGGASGLMGLASSFLGGNKE